MNRQKLSVFVLTGLLAVSMTACSSSKKSSSSSTSPLGTQPTPTIAMVTATGVLESPFKGCTVVHTSNGLIGIGQAPGQYDFRTPIDAATDGAVTKADGTIVAKLGDNVTVKGPVFQEGTDLNCQGHATTKRLILTAEITKN